jgi:hypothetical protein
MGSTRLHIGRLNWSHSGVSSFQFSHLMEYSSATGCGSRGERSAAIKAGARGSGKSFQRKFYSVGSLESTNAPAASRTRIGDI